MSSLIFLKKFERYLRKNGYSDPFAQKKGKPTLAIKFFRLPVKIYRVFIVLRGIFFDRWFDWKYNVDTCGAVKLRDLDIQNENIKFGELYDPFPSGPLKRLLSFLPWTNFSDCTFIDFGSGKGRILLIASQYEFLKVIGVEFSQKLHQIAVANIQSFRSRKRKCNDIESICVDAAKFAIPKGKCIFFIFAAFHGEVFVKVLENIKQSYVAMPRSMILVFVTDPNTHPIPEKDIAGIHLFRKVRSGPFPIDLSQRYPLAYAIFEADGDHLTGCTE